MRVAVRIQCKREWSDRRSLHSAMGVDPWEFGARRGPNILLRGPTSNNLSIWCCLRYYFCHELLNFKRCDCDSIK